MERYILEHNLCPDILLITSLFGIDYASSSVTLLSSQKLVQNLTGSFFFGTRPMSIELLLKHCLEKISTSIYAFVQILCNFTMYIFCIFVVSIEQNMFKPINVCLYFHCMGVFCVGSLFCNIVLSDLSRFAIIFLSKGELIAIF